MRCTKWITLSLFAVVAFLAGCGDVPDHSDAWLSFKYGFHCGDASHCPGLSDFDETDRYYQTLGIADPHNYVFEQWLSDNGFVDGAQVVRGAYANLGDLQIGRDMNCVTTGTKTACYVENKGPVPALFSGDLTDGGGDWPDITLALQEVDGTFSAVHPFATVAMVYDSAITGPNQVSFYVFQQACGGDPQVCGRNLLTELARLDGDNNKEAVLKSVPRMCMACHGGTYDTNSHTATGSSFLPFDVFFFRYSGKDGFTFDDQAESFRKLNAMVAATKPTAAIQELINGMYPEGVNNANSAALDGFTPAGWSDNPTLYHGVVRQYCRMCHIAQPESFAKASDFVGFAHQIQHEVCETHDMPHAQVPYGLDGKKIGFWHDQIAQHDLGNFLQSQGISSCLPHD
ncbi:MAG TPA: hypothetical protein VNI81_00745 [Candidatus Limnocylindrales bacterium]|nr:hypothetical protein [Candidatus Limnocylindrales bacterium]